MRFSLPGLFFLASAVACGASPSTEANDTDIASTTARILEFRFEGQVVAQGAAPARQAIVSQLMYVQGILTTAGNGNGKVGQVTLSDVVETIEGTKKRITYKASLPVAWPKDVPTPVTYALPLPADVTALFAFNAKYDGRCGYNEYGQENFWHDWNPKAFGCTFDAADVVATTATVGPHAAETTDKFPEYDEIWKDDRLDVVAIFGIIESNQPGDWGHIERNGFMANTRSRLPGAVVTENAPSASILNDTTITGQVTIGGRVREVKVDTLLVQDVQHVGTDFEARYDALTEKADLVLYNGHAGLGKNVNALARKGKVVAGKYQLVLLNGCQTFAYIDQTLNTRRIEANGADLDPFGTAYMDVVGNALPGYANNLATMSNSIFNAVLRADQPRSYNDLIAEMPASHIVVVFGEEDNRFHP